MDATIYILALFMSTSLGVMYVIQSQVLAIIIIEQFVTDLLLLVQVVSGMSMYACMYVWDNEHNLKSNMINSRGKHWVGTTTSEPAPVCGCIVSLAG